MSEPPETRFLRLLPQFFLFPLLVVLACLGVYFGFRALTRDVARDDELLREAASGERNTGWRAALELQNRIREDPERYRRAGFIRRVSVAFGEARARRDEGVVQYLGMALAWLGGGEAAEALLAALADEDPTNRFHGAHALGRLGEPALAGRLLALTRDPDRGVRIVAVYWGGRLGGEAAVAPLREALQDPEPEVVWNAALQLAPHKAPEALPVLLRLLDRTFVDGVRLEKSSGWSSGWPFETAQRPEELREGWMLNAIKAAAAFGHPGFRRPLEILRDGDRSLKVRDLAARALEKLKG